ncbi:uncharacterized protein LOC129599555 [Paramacrobiotus metropolitanus]|uniref:uncharacterized protein LOC129599555 n=1 Tax=Paramacrobiotus metropolitanus TaxID=2943436 RepID=UPI002445FEA3|nr:uncharacterized protein LOC129599555 [Paramacrobiotus metropolitanus]
MGRLTLIIFWTSIFLVFLYPEVVHTRGGRGGGGRGSSRSSSSRSSWGSSSPSGSSRSSWSSSPSSSSSRYSSSRTSGSSWSPSPSPSRSSSDLDFSWMPSRSTYQRPVLSRETLGVFGRQSSKWGSSASTGSRPVADYAAAGAAAVRSAANRPVIHLARPAYTRVVPVRTCDVSNGFILGRVMSASNHRHYYVPYRHSSAYTTASPPSATSGTPGTLPTRSYCSLARWNMELPFSELPNMALHFLANDSASGATFTEKAGFLAEMLNSTLAVYGDLPAAADAFQLDSGLNISKCNFRLPNPNARYAQWRPPAGAGAAEEQVDGYDHAETLERMRQVEEDFFRPDSWMCDLYRNHSSIFPDMPDCDKPLPPPPEEPFVTSIHNLLAKYTNTSENLDLLSDLQNAAKACLVDGKPGSSAPAFCLDFSLDAGQITAVGNDDSIFGNEDVCRVYLNPNVSCLNINAANRTASPCGLKQLTTLLVFARNFYLCAEPVGNNLLEYAISLQPTTTTTTTTTTTPTTTTPPPETVDTSGPRGDPAHRPGPPSLGSGLTFVARMPQWTPTGGLLQLASWLFRP